MREKFWLQQDELKENKFVTGETIFLNRCFNFIPVVSTYYVESMHRTKNGILKYTLHCKKLWQLNRTQVWNMIYKGIYNVQYFEFSINRHILPNMKWIQMRRGYGII